MKKLNPAFRNVLVFFTLFLLLGAIYYYLTQRRTVHEGMTRGEMKEAQIRVTEDYKKYFGVVPDEGMVRCEGLVVYYPGKGRQTFHPYPMFVTTPEKRDELLAKTMLAGLPSNGMGGYVDPIFPGKGNVKEIGIDADTLRLTIGTPGGFTEKDLEVTATAFLLTYSQFYDNLENVVLNAGEGVSVKVTSPGSVVEEPGPPVLLDAFLVKDEGEENPHEVRLIFDRPLSIEDLMIMDAGGRMLKGKVYLAEFSMAGIFTQGGLIELRAGEKFRVKYAVRDYLGREGEGDVAITARVEVHSG